MEQKADKINIQHFNNGNRLRLSSGPYTLAVVWKGKNRFVGLSRVNGNSSDNFSRRTGRNIAVQRAMACFDAFIGGNSKIYKKGMFSIHDVTKLTRNSIIKFTDSNKDCKREDKDLRQTDIFIPLELLLTREQLEKLNEGTQVSS